MDHGAQGCGANTIQAAAKMASWEYRPRAAKIGKGRYLTGTGFSAMRYEGTLGYNAVVATLTVEDHLDAVLSRSVERRALD